MNICFYVFNYSKIFAFWHFLMISPFSTLFYLINWLQVWTVIDSSVQFSLSVVFDSLRPHESQHARPPCPSPTPGVYPNSCPSSWWCHPAISSSVVPFPPAPIPPSIRVFPMMDKRDSNIIHAFLDYHGFHLESQKCWHRVLFNYNLFHQRSCGNFSTSIYVCPVFAVWGFFVCSVLVFTCSEWPEIYLNYLLYLKACLLLFLFDFIILFLSLLFSNARIEDYKFSSDNRFVCITSKPIAYKFSFYFLFIWRVFLNLKKKRTILQVFYIKA